MIPRLFVDAPLSQDAAAPLTAEQAHYLKNVLRREAGDAALVFNARDGEFEATILELKKRGGAARLGGRTREPVAEPDLTLCFAPVKRGPLETIVQKATELGAARLAPVITERTVATRINAARLQAIAMEAAEQSGRLSAPEVDAPVKLEDLIEQWPEERRLLFCDEAGDDAAAEWGGPEGRAAPLLDAVAGFAGAPGPWAVLTGPEGGFSPTERDRLRALPFAVPATLGPRILRADTAVIAALSLWQAALGDWRASSIAPVGVTRQ